MALDIPQEKPVQQNPTYTIADLEATLKFWRDEMVNEAHGNTKDPKNTDANSKDADPTKSQKFEAAVRLFEDEVLTGKITPTDAMKQLVEKGFEPVRAEPKITIHDLQVTFFAYFKQLALRIMDNPSDKEVWEKYETMSMTFKPIYEKVQDGTMTPADAMKEAIKLGLQPQKVDPNIFDPKKFEQDAIDFSGIFSRSLAEGNGDRTRYDFTLNTSW